MTEDYKEEAAEDDHDEENESDSEADAGAVAASWHQHIDDSTGDPYYYNSMTGATSWSPPLGFASSHNVEASAPPMSQDKGGKDDDEEEDCCVICFDESIQGVFSPCGHMVCCQVCGETQPTCPICRAESSFIKTFRN